MLHPYRVSDIMSLINYALGCGDAMHSFGATPTVSVTSTKSGCFCLLNMLIFLQK